MQKVFVERRYELEPNLEVAARIFAPEERDGCFCCDYLITWPDREKRFYGAGEDGIQALLHALMQVEVRLATSQEYKDGKLKWLGTSYLGLPSTESFSTAPPPSL